MDGKAKAISISVSSLQRQILEEAIACRECPQGWADRARIVLSIADGSGVSPTARNLRVDRKTVRLWKNRWAAATVEWEKNGKDWTQKVWAQKIEQALSDAPRSGAPCTFQAEHVCQIIALACKPPADFKIPVSHWSAADLQREVLKQKIVPAISARQVGRFLKQRTFDRTVCAIT